MSISELRKTPQKATKNPPALSGVGECFFGGQWAANLIFTQPHQTTLCIQSWHGELFHVKHMNGRGG